MALQRLDKLISSQLNLPRREVKAGIRRGKAVINGLPVLDAGRAVDPEKEEVWFGGQVVRYRAFYYLVMNKPAGVLTATRDRAARTVLDLIPEAYQRKGLFPVGRLDKDTTGLLLITDDGDFAHRMLSPKSGIYKTYLAGLDGQIPPQAVTLFSEGVTLADGTVCKPAVLKPLTETTAEIQICEGKYHQIKRMFGAVGLGVTSLSRTAVGGFVLPDFLQPGECMEAPGDLFYQIKPNFFDS